MQSQSIEPFLTILCYRIYLVYPHRRRYLLADGIGDGYRRCCLIVSSPVGLLRQLVPLALPRLLPMFGSVLHFSVIVGTFVKQLWVDLHEQLHSIVYHAMYGPATVSYFLGTRYLGALPVPMAFRVFIQRCKHDGQDDFDVVADEVAEVFIVPEIESSLGHLGMPSQ